MGVFNNLKHKTLSVIGDFAGKLNNNINSQLNKDIEISYDSLNVIYYKYYDNYKIYRAVFYKSGVNKFEKVSYKEEFSTIEDLYEFFSKYNLCCTYTNVFTKDYVFLTKSGINTEGIDLRLEKEKLADSVFSCMHSNNVLDEVDIVSSRLPMELYTPCLDDTSRLNRDRWSLDIINKYLNEGRIGVFLMSNTLISYDRGLDKISTNPKELLLDLTALCKSSQVILSHCGNLGIQMSFR